ncbi:MULTISPECIES: hypothetical protein [unclassified Ruegeria]|uniref:hypothetical protein n=1 Tax=unclassified Ruegeria TaxID=2625375 RepID=UPI001489E598|nr:MULTISPECIES: hypothetical protein [unclassified Ruegeria]
MAESSNDFDALFKSKFGFSYTEDSDALQELRVSPYDRWKLVSEILDLLPDAPASLFIHVPKTGGTTLGESVARNNLRNVVSCDAEDKEFLSMLRACCVAPNEMGILFRAHHPYGTIFKNNDESRFDFIFSSFRDPLSVHISNVTMILERLDKYYRGLDQGQGVQKFCEIWDRVIVEGELKFNNSSECAVAILASPHYVKTMAGVYDKFFGRCSDEQLRNVTFFDYRQFDTFMVQRFGFETPPERRNVAQNRKLEIQDIPSMVSQTLLEKDEQIVDRIQALISGEMQQPDQTSGFIQLVKSAFRRKRN